MGRPKTQSKARGGRHGQWGSFWGMWVLGFSEGKRLYVEDGGIKESHLRGVGLPCDRLLASLPKLLSLWFQYALKEQGPFTSVAYFAPLSGAPRRVQLGWEERAWSFGGYEVPGTLN